MTEYWGPLKWIFLHSIVSNYPSKPTYAQKLLYLRAINLVVKFIPCPICKKHFQKLLKKFPIFPNITNGKALRDYFYMLHNKVNKRLKKPTYSKGKMKEKYSNPDHKIICEYLHYLKEQVRTRFINMSDFCDLLRLLQIIHPCDKCRNRLCKYQQQDPMDNYMRSLAYFEKWFDRVFVKNDDHIKIKLKKINKKKKIKKK